MSDQSFREREIRPPALMAEQRAAALTDIGRLLSRYPEFIHVGCPACGAESASPRFQKNGMCYVDCGECETFYINPRPSPALLEWFYSGSPNYEYWNKVVFPASEDARRRRIFVPRVDQVLALCRKYSVASESLLEVGAGFGTFCAELKSRGVFSRIVAVEPTPDLAATCRERGFEVVEAPVERLPDTHAASFDIVASFEVIEHLFAPREFIAHAVRLLKPGGLLMATCPNGRGFDIETLGSSSNTVDHEHLNYFSPTSLTSMLEKSGLDVLECLTPGRLDAELVRNKILDQEFDVTHQPFLRTVLIDEWERCGSAFQQFLIDQRLSSNMWIVARAPVRAGRP